MSSLLRTTSAGTKKEAQPTTETAANDGMTNNPALKLFKVKSGTAKMKAVASVSETIASSRDRATSAVKEKIASGRERTTSAIAAAKQELEKEAMEEAKLVAKKSMKKFAPAIKQTITIVVALMPYYKKAYAAYV